MRLRIALPVAFVLATVDCSTKELAVNLLSPADAPHPFLFGFVRLTLAFNTQAAMSLPVGRYGMPILALVSLVIVAGLLRMVWRTPLLAHWDRLAFGLMLGGAIGNLLSRALSPRGVVDFLDIGVGGHRFFICNVADIGVCGGAAMLAMLLCRRPHPSIAG